MEYSQMGSNSLEAFEARVRELSGKGPLLSYSFAAYVSGLSRARLRQLVMTNKVETERVNGQLLIVMRSLVEYRRRVLRRMGPKSTAHGKASNVLPKPSSALIRQVPKRGTI
jgi:hypothetical protein